MENINEKLALPNYTQDYAFFWQTGSPFSNWHHSAYTYEGIEFNCSEQGVMWSKAQLFNDEISSKRILECGPSQQKKMKDLGRGVKHFKDSTWKKNRIRIYQEHCMAKFSQNSHLKQKLFETGNKTLVEASPNDAIWGIGLNETKAKKIHPSKWPGTNLLGIILTDIREQLKEMENADENVDEN